MQRLSERAEALASALAAERNISVDEAVAQALEEEWKRHERKKALSARLREVALDLAARGQPGGRAMSKDEVDEMWGH